MANWTMALALMFVVFPSNGIGQTKDTPVGTWRLISVTDTTEKGDVKDSFGRNPTGFLTYTADGRMMAIITFDGRKPLSLPDYVSVRPRKELSHLPHSSLMQAATPLPATK